MLCSADAELVAREAELPGLATLLSPQALHDLLAARGWGDEMPAFQAYYIRYKPGTSCLVAYQETAVDGPPVWLYAVAHRREAIKLAKARNLHREGLNDSRLIVHELGLIVYRFPLDRRLPQLEALGSSASCRKFLEQIRILPADGGAPLNWTVLRYKPERRCVAQITMSDRRWLVKLYADDRAYAAARAGSKLAAGDALRLADTAGWSRSARSLAWHWACGQPLDELSPGDEMTLLAYEAAGAALADLHHRSARTPLRYDGRAERNALHCAARSLAALAPDEAPRVARLANQMETRLAAIPDAGALIHGDFSPDQVLIDGIDAGRPRTTLLDLDRMGAGHPAADWGTLHAWLQRAVADGACAPCAAKDAFQAFADGYGSKGVPPAEDAVRLHTAMRLLRLAPEAFRARKMNWRAAINDSLQHIEEVLDVD